MRTVTPDVTWPESWKYSYRYDLLEIYGAKGSRGYAYAYANRRRHTLELVQKVASPGARILDVAAAQGNFSLSLAEMGYNVTWNDLREDLAGYVALKRERGSIEYAPGNVLCLDLGRRFDVVLMTEVIEHVAHPDAFFRKIAEFLVPGGYVVMSTPNGEYFRNRLPRFSRCEHPERYEAQQFKPDADGHIFLLHLDEIQPLASQAGLSVLEIRLFTNPLTHGHLKTEALLQVLPAGCVAACERITGSLPTGLTRRLHLGMAVLFQHNGSTVRKL